MSWVLATRQRLPALTLRGFPLKYNQCVRAYSSSADSSDSTATATADAADASSATTGAATASASAVSEDMDLAQMREAVKSLSFANPEASQQLSPQMREKLSAEFDKFLQDFVHSVDPSQRSAEFIAEKVSGVDVSAFSRMSKGDSTRDGNLSGRSSFPSLAFTEPDQPYSDSELYVRQLFHASKVAGLGANISDNVYRPHETLHKPQSIAETGISSLMTAGGHLGHATNRVRANCLPYIYGIREGIHIIDLQQTLAALRRVARVVEELSRKGGLVLFVGTRDGQRRTVEKAAQRSHGYYVHNHWVPGTFTNYQVITDQKQKVGRIEVNMADESTGRQLSPSLHDTIIKPDLAIILNPVENRALLSECLKLRIPTAGIVDTDSEPSLMTYAIPGNDDSLRFTDLVAGVLSKAAERGRNIRLAEYRQLQSTKQNLRNGEAATNAAPPPERKLADMTETEKELL